MVIGRYFIGEGIKETQIERFISQKFERADYSHINIQRTPLGTRIVVYVGRPGLIIGKSGKIVKDLTYEIKEKFKLENPMLDVREVENQFLDAQIVSSKIAKSIERGSFYKKVINFYLNEIMKSGAVGVQIKASGKLGGARGRLQKFKKGYIKHAGYYADNILDKGFSKALVKLGSVGIEVRIMKEKPDELLLELEEKVVEEKIDEIKEKTTKKIKKDVKRPKKKVKSKKSGKGAKNETKKSKKTKT